MRRTPDGYLGGVCAGLAYRWNVSPLLVRVGALALAFVGGLGVLAYGLAWLFVPMAGDDQIELELALNRKVSGRFLAALALAVVGLVAFLSRHFLALVAVVVLAGVALLIAKRGDAGAPAGAGAPDAGAAGNAGAPGFAADADAPTEQFASDTPTEVVGPQPQIAQAAYSDYSAPTEDFGQAHFGAQQPVPPIAPTAPRPNLWNRYTASPKVSATYIFGTLALAALAAAIVVIVMGLSVASAAIAVGAAAIVTGVSLVTAGARGRRGTWLTAASVLAAAITLPLVPFAYFLPERVAHATDVALFSSTSEPTRAALVARGALDVSTLPDGAHISAGAGRLDLHVDPSDPVILEITTVGVVDLDGADGWNISGDGTAMVSEEPGGAMGPGAGRDGRGDGQGMPGRGDGPRGNNDRDGGPGGPGPMGGDRRGNADGSQAGNARPDGPRDGRGEGPRERRHISPRNHVKMSVTLGNPGAATDPDRARRIKIELGFGRVNVTDKIASAPLTPGNDSSPAPTSSATSEPTTKPSESASQPSPSASATSK